jgi:hypothetical protein
VLYLAGVNYIFENPFRAREFSHEKDEFGYNKIRFL